MRLLILLSIFILSSCGKRLPITDVRSLSGIDYHGPNARVSLIHDFDKGTMFMVSHSAKVTGGMFYSSLNFGLNAYGSELYFFNNATGKSELVADILPGRDGSNPTNFSDPGGDWVYFLANGEDVGREIHRVHKTTFVIEQLPEGLVGDNEENPGSDDSFESTEHGDKGFIVIQENPFIAYGRKSIQLDAGNFVSVLHRYVHDWTSSPIIHEVIEATQGATKVLPVDPNNTAEHVFFPHPTNLTYMEESIDTNNTNKPMVSFIVNYLNYSYVSVVKSGVSGVAVDLTSEAQQVKSLVSIIGRSPDHRPSHFIAKDSDGSFSEIYELSYSNSGESIGPLKDIWSGGIDTGNKIFGLIAHNNKLYFIGDLSYIDCVTQPCSSDYAVGREIGVYNPSAYSLVNKTGLTTIDINTTQDGAGPDTLGSGATELISAGNRVCVSADDGASGSEVVCLSDGTLAITVFDVNPGPLGVGAISKVYLNENLIFNRYKSADTYQLMHLNLLTSAAKDIGPVRKLFENDSGNKYPNTIISHNSGKYAFELNYHDYLNGGMIRDDGTYLDPGLVTQKTPEFDGSINESGLPLLRFIDGDLLFGSHLLNRETSWVYNEATKQNQKFNIGAIISEKYIKHNGRYYVSVNYRGKASLAWIDHANGTSGVILKSCEQKHDANPANDTDEFCHMLHSDGSVMTGNPPDNLKYEYVGVSGSLKILGENGGYIFFMAKGRFAGTIKALHRFNTSNGDVDLLGNGTFANVKLVYDDENVIIMNGSTGGTNKIFVTTDFGDNVYNLNNGVSDFHDIEDFYVEEDTLVFIGDDGLGHDLIYVDISDTSIASLNTTLSAPHGLDLVDPNHIHMLKDDGILTTFVTNSGIYKYNHSTNISSLIAGSAKANIKKRGKFTHSISGSNYYVLDINALEVDHFSMSALSPTSCAISLNSLFLTKTVLIEQCDGAPNEVGVFFRSTGQRLDLTSFGIDWNKADTRYKILYDVDGKTVISFMKIFNGDSDDIRENKVLEFSSDGSVSILFDNAFKVSTFDLGEGSHVSCLLMNDKSHQFILHDFKNNKVEPLSGDISCIPDEASNPSQGRLREAYSEVYHIDDGKLKGTMKDEDDKRTLGFELYEVKI